MSKGGLTTRLEPRRGWNHVAPRFHGGTALPEYGPLVPTEDTLRLLEVIPGLRALELG